MGEISEEIKLVVDMGAINIILRTNYPARASRSSIVQKRKIEKTTKTNLMQLMKYSSMCTFSVHRQPAMMKDSS